MAMTCCDTEYSKCTTDKKRGDIVVVDVSVWTAFRAALGWRDRNITSSESHRTRASSIDTNTGAGTRKMRPAIILERVDNSSGSPTYLVTPLTSMCGTPYDSLHANAKDLLIPLVGRSKQELPVGLPTISTTPEWHKNYQYVVTFAIQTSNVWEWPWKVIVSEENLQLLEKVGREQRRALMTKLNGQPEAAKAWFNDVETFFAET